LPVHANLPFTALLEITKAPARSHGLDPNLHMPARQEHRRRRQLTERRTCPVGGSEGNLHSFRVPREAPTVPDKLLALGRQRDRVRLFLPQGISLLVARTRRVGRSL
jgi:hypothetical protein